MKIADLARDVKTVAASTGIDLDALGFEYGHGREVTVRMFPRTTAAATPTQVGNIETSDALATGYAVAAGYIAANGIKSFVISAQRYVRVDNTAGTAASTDFEIEQGP